MNKYIVIGLIFTLSSASYAAQVDCTLGHERNAIEHEALKAYVDVNLIRAGHHNDVLNIIKNNPIDAKKLKELYDYCNSSDILNKLLTEPSAISIGSFYLVQHASSAPRTFARKEIDEYDSLIVKMGLDRYMRALRVENIELYVDTSLIKSINDLRIIHSILGENPEKANRLKELYSICNNDKVISKKLIEASNERTGSLYLPEHRRTGVNSSVRKEINEYDALIVELGLDIHMNALRERMDNEHISLQDFSKQMQDVKKTPKKRPAINFNLTTEQLKLLHGKKYVKK